MIGEPKILIIRYSIIVRCYRRKQCMYESQWCHTMIWIIGEMKSYIYRAILLSCMWKWYTLHAHKCSQLHTCCRIHIFCLRINVYTILLDFSVSLHAEFSFSKSVLIMSLVITTFKENTCLFCMCHTYNFTVSHWLNTYVNSSFIFFVTSHWRHILSSGNSYLRAVLCIMAVSKLWGLKNPASHTDAGSWN